MSDGKVYKSEGLLRRSAKRRGFKESDYEIKSLDNGGGFVMLVRDAGGTSVTADHRGDTNLTEGIGIATKPVPKKHVSTTPWKPASLLHIPEHLKDPNFVYRHCTKSRPGNIQKKLAEGWVIDNELIELMAREGLSATPTVLDGKPLDGTLQVREMIVMKLPIELKKQRDAYYARRSGAALSDAKTRFESDVRRIPGIKPSLTYGTITENKE